MGMWNITIRGCGAHHNQDYEKDANKMAAKFVQELRDAGHVIEDASITYGGRDELHRNLHPGPELVPSTLPAPPDGVPV